MIKRTLDKIPPHIQLLLQLYVLNLVLFFCIRLIFYFVNRSSDTGEVPFFEKLWAFRMGLEFDTAVFNWIAFVPMVLWSIAWFFNFKKWMYHIGYFPFVLLLLTYYFICVTDIPYYSQFGAHLNKNALLWNDSPSFIAGMIFARIL